jgi:hypothetical protein
VALIDVRKEFLEATGRYDLVDPVTLFDTGADKFIRAGQRWLERTFHIAKNAGRHFATQSVGTWYALVPHVRSIHSVWMSGLNSEGTITKWKLERVELSMMRGNDVSNPASIDNGQPLEYSMANLRSVPETASSTTVDQWGTVVYSSAVDHYNYNGIVWLPPSDTIVMLEVHGTFRHPTLTADSDKNYWSEEERQTLVHAACRALEGTYRNTAGVKDWEYLVAGNMHGLELEFTDEESSEIHGMEG